MRAIEKGRTLTMVLTSRRSFLAGVLAVLGGTVIVGCDKTEPVIDTTTPLMSEEEAGKEKEPDDLTDDEEAEEGDKPIMDGSDE